MNFLLKIIPNKIKIWLLNLLYKKVFKFSLSGLAAGSFFIYKGVNKAILINYFDIKTIWLKKDK